jgi:hypothetical protein
MNEFEWRRQLRELRQPELPRRDLWPSIHAALDHAEHAQSPGSEPLPQGRVGHRKSWLAGAAVAAMLVLSAGSVWHVFHMPEATPVANVTPAATRWKPADPRLVGAAIELNAAQVELKLALRQSPDSAALKRLLDRTQMQQTQWRQLADQAG